MFKFLNRRFSFIVLLTYAFLVLSPGLLQAGDTEKQYKPDVLWTFTDEPLGHHTPAVNNGRVYVGSMHGTMYCLDAKNGELIWEFQTDHPIDDTAPLVINGRLIFVNADNRLFCLDAETGKKLWSMIPEPRIREDIRPRPITPSANENSVYFGRMNERLHAINLKTGQQKWSQRMGNGPSTNIPICTGEAVFGHNTESRLFRLDAKTGKIKWANEMEILTSLSLQDRHLYGQVDGRNIFCLDQKNGEQVWVARGVNKLVPMTSPGLYDGHMVVATSEDLFALNQKNGNKKWVFPKKEHMSSDEQKQTRIFNGVNASSPPISGGRVFMASWDGILYSLNLYDGTLHWKKKFAEDAVVTLPAISNGRAFVLSYYEKRVDGEFIYEGENQNTLYCIETNLPDDANDWPMLGGNPGRTGTPPEKDE